MIMIPRFSPLDDDQPERQNECTCYTDCRSDSHSGRLTNTKTSVAQSTKNPSRRWLANRREPSLVLWRNDKI